VRLHFKRGSRTRSQSRCRCNHRITRLLEMDASLESASNWASLKASVELMNRRRPRYSSKSAASAGVIRRHQRPDARRRTAQRQRLLVKPDKSDGFQSSSLPPLAVFLGCTMPSPTADQIASTWFSDCTIHPIAFSFVISWCANDSVSYVQFTIRSSSLIYFA